jgi:hypothetical protein
MSTNVLRFASPFLVMLALLPMGAHLLELANKLPLSRDDYLVAQRLYRGWALGGVVIVAAIVATAFLAARLARDRRGPGLAIVALACLLATQVLFWTITFPVNQATDDWTRAPADWQALRLRWEYSHAASAVLGLVAFVTLLLSEIRAAPRGS